MTTIHFSRSGCSCPRLTQLNVRIDHTAFERMMNIAKRVSDEYHTEVLFFLKAKRSDPYMITDIVIPEDQELSGAHANTKDEHGNSLFEKMLKEVFFTTEDDILIGTGHSHGTMGVMWSGTDDTDLKNKYYLLCNEGYPFIDIVVDARRRYKCRVAIKTDCGDFGLVNDVQLDIIQPMRYGMKLPLNPMYKPAYSVEEEFSKLKKPDKPLYTDWSKKGYKGYVQSGLFGGIAPRTRWPRDSETIADQAFNRYDKDDTDDWEDDLCIDCGKKLVDKEYYEAGECELCGDPLCGACVEKILEKFPEEDFVACNKCMTAAATPGSYKDHYNDGFR